MSDAQQVWISQSVESGPVLACSSTQSLPQHCGLPHIPSAFARLPSRTHLLPVSKSPGKEIKVFFKDEIVSVPQREGRKSVALKKTVTSIGLTSAWFWIIGF